MAYDTGLGDRKMEGMCMYGGCDENDVDPRGRRTEKGKKGEQEGTDAQTKYSERNAKTSNCWLLGVLYGEVVYIPTGLLVEAVGTG